ncbi:peptidoglycan-binding protein [Mongoliimonas terrestris]|uniref:peptidoglycan-binding protein n=1 Tax=Mongoliimonas terrestris TaxID=1709001 RepID=UPI0009498171|nr:peptidoglycan-binding protein [Mongoliimonas terrestris]
MTSRSASRQAHAFGGGRDDDTLPGLSAGPERVDFGAGERTTGAVEVGRGERGDEQIGRILQSLDKLGARIKAMSAEPADAVRSHDPGGEVVSMSEPQSAPRGPVPERRQRVNPSLELQRAVEQIVRKRDAIDRAAAPARPEPAPRARLPDPGPAAATLPPVAAHPADSAALDGMREEIRALRAAMADLAPAAPLARLEGLYDSIVAKLDGMQDLIGDPRVLTHMIDSLAEVRRTLADAPKAGDVRALATEVEALAAKLEGLSGTGTGTGREALEELEYHLAQLATAVVDLDVRGAVNQVEDRLADVLGRIAAVEGRLPDGGTLEELARGLDRQGTALAQVQQKVEQIPRVAFAVERQSAAFDEMAGTLAILPRLSDEVSDIRQAVADGAARTGEGTAAVLERFDALNRRLDEAGPVLDPEVVAGIGQRLDDLAGHLARLDGPADTAALAQIEGRLGELADTIDRRLAALSGDLDARLAHQFTAAVERIEAEVSRNADGDRLAGIETAIGRLADSLGAGPIADVESLVDEIARLRAELTDLPAVSMVGVEAEIRTLANRVDALARPSADARAFERLETRLADMMARLDDRPNGLDGMADALGRIEAALGRTAEAAPAGRSAGELDAVRQTADALDQLKTDLGGFLGELQAAGRRDRDLLASMNETLERLVAASRQPAPVVMPTAAVTPVAAHTVAPISVSPAAPAPSAPVFAPRAADEPNADPAVYPLGEDDLQPTPGVANPDSFESTLGLVRRAAPEQRPIAVDMDSPLDRMPPPAESRASSRLDAAPEPQSWDEIERTLAETLGRRGGRRTVDRPHEPIAVEAVLPDEAEPAEPLADADRPLEPGSGKPSAPPRAAAPAADEAARPKAEPSKADFIAAARRAAQAATPPRPEPAGPRPVAGMPETGERAGGLVGVLKTHRRKLLIAAAGLVAVVIAARLVVGFLSDAPEVAPVDVSAPLDDVGTGDPMVDLSTAAKAELAELAAGAGETLPTPEGTPPAVAPIPPAAMPDSVAVQPAPLGPAGSFDRTASTEPSASATDPAPAAETAAIDPPPAADEIVDVEAAATPSPVAAVPLPPEAVGSLALRQAAAGGNPVAQFEVGARYTDGRGVAQDLAEAAVWYERAAASGLAPAQYRLGSLYEKGQGVARDVKTAERWYRSAAEAGNAKAMHNLAVLNAEGSLGAPDYTAAARWFEAAADLGVRDSQYNLGILYARGLGVARDLTASYKWFAIAATAGDVDAAKKRDDVAQVLDKDSLARSRLAVETWSARTPDPQANEIRIEDSTWSQVPENTASVTTADPIATAQRLLAARGYNVGPADGKLGQRTRDAVTAFQASKGLPATGVIDTTLLRALAEQEI